MSGSGASTRASATRRAWPPESVLEFFIAGEAEFVQQGRGAMLVLAFSESSGDIANRGLEADEIGLLRKILHARLRLQKAAPGIRLDQPGGDFQQSGFAGTVAADKAEPLARRN